MDNRMLIDEETIINPLSESELNKKSLCDYVINVASGCLHACKFCYVPSTPVIRMRAEELKKRGVKNPQLDWGNYLFIRSDIPEKLDSILTNKRKWKETPSGKGVVLLCSGTDPYQNGETARITRETVKVLLKHNKRVRILTRSPLWTKDLDILVHPNVTVGMSLPHFNDEWSRQIEPGAPLPSDRVKALEKGKQKGCRIYVAIAPTPPMMKIQDFVILMAQLHYLEPEVIFWEPINARGTNGKRMLAAGLDWAEKIMSLSSAADIFLEQRSYLRYAAKNEGLLENIHIWPDVDTLNHLLSQGVTDLKEWFYMPTIEKWE
jgi:DNA repair photolyase